MRIPTPTVPVSSQSLGQFSAPTATPMQDATGGLIQDLGRSLLSAGASASRLGQQEQAQLDHGFLMEADAIAAEYARTAVGAYQQKAGLDAIESFEPIHSGLRDKLLNLRDTARSDQQRQALDRILAQRFQDASDRMVTRRGAAIQERAIGGAKAGMVAGINDYIASIGNPEDMLLSREVAIRRTQEHSKLVGEDGDMARLSMLDTTTKMHLGASAALLQSGRSYEARDYLEHWHERGEIGEADYRKARDVVHASVLENTARDLAEREPSVAKQFEWVDKNMQGEDAASTRRHIQQIDDQRRRRFAAEYVQAEKSILEWLGANPKLSITDNPELAALADRYGVVVKRTRTTDQGWLDSFYAAPPARLEDLRQLDDNQLHQTLAPHLSEHDEASVTKKIRGDESGATILDRTKLLAQQLGMLPSDGSGIERAEATKAFLAWRVNTIDPMLRALSDELKRPLTPRDFDERIFKPMMEDRVSVRSSMLFDSLSQDWEPMPVEQARQRGFLPSDDPATPQDESLDFSKAQDVYVTVGTEQVFLREIPMEERFRIREQWRADPKHRGEWLTAQREAEIWLQGGAVGSPERQRDRAAIDRDKAMREIEGMK